MSNFVVSVSQAGILSAIIKLEHKIVTYHFMPVFPGHGSGMQIQELPDINFLSSAPGKSYSEALQQVLRSYAADRWLSVNEASECVGASMRTMQRRLSTEQTSYSRVLEQARAEMARELLESTEASLADIAHELGYPSPGNFTRAFRRWSGVSPSEFRRHRKS